MERDAPAALIRYGTVKWFLAGPCGHNNAKSEFLLDPLCQKAIAFGTPSLGVPSTARIYNDEVLEPVSAHKRVDLAPIVFRNIKFEGGRCRIRPCQPGEHLIQLQDMNLLLGFGQGLMIEPVGRGFPYQISGKSKARFGSACVTEECGFQESLKIYRNIVVSGSQALNGVPNPVPGL